jgi:predicted ATPase/DNA-binding winged helix-turn-helix (wHTH) protein
MANASLGSDRFVFGPFVLCRRERQLTREGVAVRIGSRALDILLALVDRAGQIVSHRDLMERVWPNTTVDESSLRVHIVNLRKALGETGNRGKYVSNIPGRGYSFIGTILASASVLPADNVDKLSALSTRPHLPHCLKRMVGRDAAVEAVKAQIQGKRFVSIVAPGGIGKTTVAVAAAHALAAEFSGAVFFVDFGSLTDPRLVARTLASTLGVSIESTTSLIGALMDRRALIVLDNCEHLVETIAPLAERIVAETDGIYILATSREALRVEGEHVYRLSALHTPSQSPDLTAEEALNFPAVQLFVERASAGGTFKCLTDTDAPTVAGICRNLDGMPLAIELAAGRVTAHGLQGTAALLENRFRLDWYGRRTASPRHQTLNSMLDWSYRLLPATEQFVLRRISIFAGSFDYAATKSVTLSDCCDEKQSSQALVGLVEKSMLSSVSTATGSLYRLLDTTRAYASEKLRAAREVDAVSRLHSLHFLQVLEQINSDGSYPPKFGGPFRMLPFLGNVRKALEWSFSECGDRSIGVSLVVAAAPSLAEACLLEECAIWAERALSVLPDESRGTKVEMILQEAFATSLMFTRGNGEEVQIAMERGLALASTTGDILARLRLMSGLATLLVRIGEMRASAAVSRQIGEVASELGDPTWMMFGDVLNGTANHLVGKQLAARQCCEAGVASAAEFPDTSESIFSWVSRILVVASLARAMWILGFPDQAIRVAEQALEDGVDGGRPIQRCMSCIYTVQVFLWCGDYSKASEIIDSLIAHASQHALRPYHAVGLGLRGELLLKTGHFKEGVELLQKSLGILNEEKHFAQEVGLRASLAEGLSALGLHEAALSSVNEAIERIEHNGNSFDFSEVLRIKATVLMKKGRQSLIEAEACLLSALHRARSQSDLSWELRIVGTLADLMVEQNRREQAQLMLSDVLSRFTEGFGTADFQRASGKLEVVRIRRVGT